MADSKTLSAFGTRRRPKKKLVTKLKVGDENIKVIRKHNRKKNKLVEKIISKTKAERNKDGEITKGWTRSKTKTTSYPGEDKKTKTKFSATKGMTTAEIKKAQKGIGEVSKKFNYLKDESSEESDASTATINTSVNPTKTTKKYKR